MPRYFFHFYEPNSKNLVRDSQGAIFSDFREAKNEAVGLSRDIAGLGIDRSTWQLLVFDENGDQVVRMPLSKIRVHKFRRWIDLAHRIAIYEPRFGPGVFTSLLMAAVLAMIGQAALLIGRVSEPNRSSYHLASAETGGATINVRFVPRTSIAEIQGFLQAYKASVVNGPLSGGWYRLRIPVLAASPEELNNVASKMKHEAIVLLVVVGSIEND